MITLDLPMRAIHHCPKCGSGLFASQGGYDVRCCGCLTWYALVPAPSSLSGSFQGPNGPPDGGQGPQERLKGSNGPPPVLDTDHGDKRNYYCLKCKEIVVWKEHRKCRRANKA